MKAVSGKRDQQWRGFHVQWDLYRVLGVNRRAAEPQIKAAFHNLAKAYHPDARPDDWVAEEQFKEISAAYDVLKRKESRALYDRYRSRRRRQDFVVMAVLSCALPLFVGGLVATALWLKGQQNPDVTVAAVTERDERVHSPRALSAPQTQLRNASEHPLRPSHASTEAIQHGREGPAALSAGLQASQDAGPRTETPRHAVVQVATLPEIQEGGAEESRKYEESAGFTGRHAIGKSAPTTSNGKTRKTVAPQSTSGIHAAAWQNTAERPALATRGPSAVSERFFDPAGTSR
jgi:hypothetical protein